MSETNGIKRNRRQAAKGSTKTSRVFKIFFFPPTFYVFFVFF
uniref:Uncharacterized protein n=1 Tax=Anguilla anguilla TaxID=7936 RepID=A0A0E9WCT0_ANGAN